MGKRAVAALIGGALLVTACQGGSSSGTSGPGRLTFTAVWRVPPAPQRVALQAGPPAGVNSIRVVFTSLSGPACCIAIDPTLVPTENGHGAVVLDGLPLGAGTVQLWGFGTNFSPAFAGISTPCLLDPPSAGQPCDPSRTADPLYESQPSQVTIAAGIESDAGTIELLPVSAPTPTPPLTPPLTRSPTPPAGTPSAATATPTPTATPAGSPTVSILGAGGNIAAAVRRLPPGSTLIVSPGLYQSVGLGPGDVSGPITLIADVTGMLTHSAPDPVTIRGPAHGAAVQLLDVSGLTLDGFTMFNSGGTGIDVESSAGIVIRNCVLDSNVSDAIRVLQSAGVMIFNNLIFNNGGAGIRATSTTNLQAINTTLYLNRDNGIVLSGDTTSTIENNICNRNAPLGIVADAASAAAGYRGDFNLNSDGYGPDTPAGGHDLNTTTNDNPFFLGPNVGDFHLQRGISGSTSPAIDAGDDTIDPTLLAMLLARTTEADGFLDVAPVDLGYHYLPPSAFGTPTPGAPAH